MDSHVFIFASSFILIILLPKFYSEDDDGYRMCNTPYDCGNLKNLSYPFWSDKIRPQICGQDRYKLKCQDNQDPVITIGSVDFRVLRLNQDSKIMTIARQDFWDDACKAANSKSTNLDYTPFRYLQPDGLLNLSFFYNCSTKPQIPDPIGIFSCPGSSLNQFYTTETAWRGNGLDPNLCPNRIDVPVPSVDLYGINVSSIEVTKLAEIFLRQGFDVTYEYEGLCHDCKASSGVCGTNMTVPGFACYCGHPYLYTCYPHGKALTSKLKVIIGVSSAGIGILIVCIISYCFKRKNSLHKSIGLFRKIDKANQDFEVFMRNYGSLAPTRYSFSDIKKFTDMFKDKLGQGGYGSVYKGKLFDGRLVAIKLLKESVGSGEEFMNEVASISRTSHINIVNLLGYCLDSKKRALIYEFMPNGSLEKFISNQNQSNIDQCLEWEKFYQIVVGVARGLEYLHRGCNTRIVHFDIKPHNILLDKDFCPKISDFGLAKLCTKKESILSMLDARGTIGYIAPEVFSRHFGGVSHKSDVYSYGMMLLEMVGEKKRDDDIASDASEKYFPYWVYKHLELNNFELEGLITMKDIAIVRKITIVGLWCIQLNPLERPSMSKVIEMLEGSQETLKIPPKPFLFSPPQLPSLSSTVSTT